MDPEMSGYFEGLQPSDIRLASIEASGRQDANVIDLSIGNVSFPMYPAMAERMHNLGSNESPFKDGVAKYTPTKGDEETIKAFKNAIESSGFNSDGLHVQVTNGGSQAMRLVIAGVCGNPGSEKSPLMVLDPAYTNYNELAAQMGRRIISVQRRLQNGAFTLPSEGEIVDKIRQYNPNALLVIPYDNPTGQWLDRKTLAWLGSICAEHNLWMISDEAYRELLYLPEGDKRNASSIWGLTNREVPGIEGRRVCIEPGSKLFNMCGLRIGALSTDNERFHNSAVAAQTPELCASAIGQFIFGAIAHVSHEELNRWYSAQREYYGPMMKTFVADMQNQLPGIIVSKPEASIYSVVDVSGITSGGFDSTDFVLHCAKKGGAKYKGENFTVLLSPMGGFYSGEGYRGNPGKAQMRVAYVESPKKMKIVPQLFAELFQQFEASRYR